MKTSRPSTKSLPKVSKSYQMPLAMRQNLERAAKHQPPIMAVSAVGAQYTRSWGGKEGR